MQLFILDRDPEKSAQMLCDVHLRKMCLETAQILSCVLVRSGSVPESGMPRPYNRHHPVVKALDTPFKINYVLHLNSALHKEFFHRFGKHHVYHKLCPLYYAKLYQETTTEDWSFCRNFKDFTPVEDDIVSAYRSYYRYKKSIIRQWQYTRRNEPEWLLVSSSKNAKC